jgi:hypothetical protein
MSADELRAEMGKLVMRESLSEAVEELSKRVLHDSKCILLADELADAVHEYMVAVVKHGPYDVGQAARTLLQTLQRYREAREVKP